MSVTLRGTVQDRFPVWENIVLVEAENEEKAFAKAERHGRESEGDDGGSFRWGMKPARWVFVGVRKLTECVLDGETPGDYTEVSYSEFELESRDAVNNLAAGEPVWVLINDRYRPLRTTTRSPKHGKTSGFAPGQAAPQSGLYVQVGPRGGRGREVVVLKGEPFPPTTKPGSTYTLVDFKTYRSGSRRV
jgi:hypothetical protein